MNRPPYDRFSRWVSQVRALHQDRLQIAPSFSITLSPEHGPDTTRIGEALVEYLNEFDENAGGSWAVFDAESLRVIDQHGGVRELPVGDAQPMERLERSVSQNEHEPLLCGMARLGAVVVVENRAYLATQQIPRVFHVRLTHPTNGFLEDDARPFHLLVNMARFGPDSMVSIIGDSALEWASRGHDPMDRVVGFMA